MRTGLDTADRAALDSNRRVIITADDLGLDPRVNAAIVRSFALGLISHASLIVNLDGFQDACRLIETHQLQDRVGLHLNLTEGPALTEHIRRTPLCVDGCFVPSNRLRYYRIVSPETRRAIAEEIAAQIALARRAGIALTHLDSHNDVHTAPMIARLVAIAAKDSGIARVRPARNCGPRQGAIRWLHHRRYNRALDRHGLRGVEYFGTIDDLVWLCERGSHEHVRSVEVMTHPRLGAGNVVIDAPATEPLAQRIERLARCGFDLLRPSGSERATAPHDRAV